MKNLKIKTKLIFALGMLSILLIAISVGAFFSLKTNNDSTENIYKESLLSMGHLSNVVLPLVENQSLLNRSLTDTPEQINKNLDTIAVNIQELNKSWKLYTATKATPEEKIISDNFTKLREEYVKTVLTDTLKALKDNDMEKAKDYLKNKAPAYFIQFNKMIDDLMEIQLSEGKREFESSQKIYETFMLLSLVVVIVGLIFTFAIAVWLIKSISVPLNKAVQIANTVAAGDLTQDIIVHSQDETGQLLEALKNMNTSLRSIVGEVRVSTDMISTASSEIASGNMDLSGRTEQQAGALEETASSMEELTSTVKGNTANAQKANKLANEASVVAVEGGQAVEEVVKTMELINNSSKKIVDIISVIDSIAFQTNILALNAAVEAARAGEQGRGFAVVATEVRSLAHRSAQAAKEIKDLINTSVSNVTNGTIIVNEAGSKMDEIVKSIMSVTEIMSEITTAGREQEMGIEQINRAISEMDGVTQQNAALVEESAAAAQSLNDQANNLSQVVSIFKT